MASVKSTFTLNEEAAQRLSERERLHLLTAFDSLVPAVPPKPSGEVDAELEEIRRARQLADRSRSSSTRPSSSTR